MGQQMVSTYNDENNDHTTVYAPKNDQNLQKQKDNNRKNKKEEETQWDQNRKSDQIKQIPSWAID